MAGVKISYRSFRELLECPICTEQMHPPVYQCATGHILCSACKNKLQRCPSCQDSLLGIRCLFADKVMGCLTSPCKYKQSGCRKMVSYTEKLTHEEQCDYRPFSCPISSSCDDQVAEDLKGHLKDCHNCTSQEGSEIDTIVFLSNSQPPAPSSPLPPSFVSIHSCFGKLFLLFCDWIGSVDARYIRISLALVGDREEAKTFRYQLQVGQSSDCLSWTGLPRSIRDRTTSINQVPDRNCSDDGLIVPFCRFKQSVSEGVMLLQVLGSVWRPRKRTRNSITSGSSGSKPNAASGVVHLSDNDEEERIDGDAEQEEVDETCGGCRA